MQTEPTDYDVVPYPSLSYAQTHPDRLSTIATLLGLQPAAVTHCRVLELGCASGGNLMPMAQGLPGSEFVGVDLSQAQIDKGGEAVRTLGLPNMRLLALDILDFPAELGAFDYIVAHGVYSWVPPQVRDRLLQVCKNHLAPQGVAYVSYNCYPGWHMMGILRDAMLYRTRDVPDPTERATLARGMLDFMYEGIPTDNSALGAFLKGYMQFLQGELKGVSARGNAFLLHDELERINDPVYFAQFAGAAAGHGLQFLAEAEFSEDFPKNLSDATMATLQQLSHDIVEMEQYTDFLRSRMFRQTLLCHAEQEVRRTLPVGLMNRLWVTSRSRPVSETPDLRGTTVEQFRAPEGGVLTTDHPVSKAAMVYLNGIYPRAASFGELLTMAREVVESPADSLADDAANLQANLLKAYTYNSQLVELHTFMPAVSPQVSERPVASPVARYEAREGAQDGARGGPQPGGTIVTNAWHKRVQLSPVRQRLLLMLDGSNELAVLDAVLPDLDPNCEGGTLQDHLQFFARAALLVG